MTAKRKVFVVECGSEEYGIILASQNYTTREWAEDAIEEHHERYPKFSYRVVEFEEVKEGE